MHQAGAMTDAAPHAASWFDALQRGGDDLPPALVTLGFELLSVSHDPGQVEARFVGRREFANLLGGIQGGFLAAMLDGSLSCALLATMPAGHFAPTLEMTINYLQVAPVGPLLGRGRVVRRGRTIAFLAGELCTPDGEIVTTATAVARLIDRTNE